jgi:predicted dehydrogenase
VLSTDLQQYTWNRLIEDFIGAIRNNDKDHKSYPSLPTLTDGLRTEEVIDAARRSNSTGCWATVAVEGAIGGGLPDADVAAETFLT